MRSQSSIGRVAEHHAGHGAVRRRNAARTCNRRGCPFARTIREIHGGDDGAILIQAVVRGRSIRSAAEDDQPRRPRRTFRNVGLPEDGSRLRD